jgi:toxin-antitoxin system PIN domain toxin
VIAVDTNVLVHAHRRDAPMHQRCAHAVRSLAEAPHPWAIPWPAVHEFLAIVTHPRIFDPPSTTAQALDQVTAWTASPSLVLLSEGATHLTTLQTVVNEGAATGPRIHDARIAALCIDADVRTLWTFDRDFTRWAPRLYVEAPPPAP